jgi:hypothetical protein
MYEMQVQTSGKERKPKGVGVIKGAQAQAEVVGWWGGARHTSEAKRPLHAAEVCLSSLALYVTGVVVGVAASTGALPKSLEIDVVGDIAVNFAVDGLLDANFDLKRARV